MYNNSHMFLISKKGHFRSQNKLEELQQDKLKKLRRVVQTEFYQLKKIQSEIATTLQKFQFLFSTDLANLWGVLFRSGAPIMKQNDRYQTSNQAKRYDRRQSKRKIIEKAENIRLKAIFQSEFKQLRNLEFQEYNLRVKNEELQRERRSLSNIKQLYLEKCESNRKISAKKIETSTKLTRNHEEGNCSPTFGYQKSINYPNNEGKARNYSYSTHKKSKQNIEHCSIGVLKCSQGHLYYRGQLISGVPHGKGSLKNCCDYLPFNNPKLLSYQGQFEQGLFQGKGTLILKGGVRFQGTFKGGKRHGEGVIFMGQTGEKGRWIEDKLI